MGSLLGVRGRAHFAEALSKHPQWPLVDMLYIVFATVHEGHCILILYS